MPQLGKILSLEDNDTDFMALQFALRAAGVNNPIERCEDGNAAMLTLLGDESGARQLDASLILLDLNLPGIDGLQILKAFRARDPGRRVPVVVLSTSSHPRDIDACYRAGADAYLVKPFEIEDWETKVGSVAVLWLATTGPQGDAPEATAKTEGGFEFAGAWTSKKAKGTLWKHHRAQLTRAIEGEIIPRLLLAHGAVGDRAPMEASGPEDYGKSDEVAELAYLVLARDAAVAASYVETMRVQGTTLETVFQGLVAPAARLIGDLWKADLCSFNEFSEALARLQLMLAELNPTQDKGTMH